MPGTRKDCGKDPPPGADCAKRSLARVVDTSRHRPWAPARQSGHDREIAGPRVLEHIVDTVLDFEGDKQHGYRLLRAMKNRFGPTEDIALFQMAAEGLQEVSNPSFLFLQERMNKCQRCFIDNIMECVDPKPSPLGVTSDRNANRVTFSDGIAA